MEHSRLGQLPVEIRVEIFSYALTHTDPVTLQVMPNASPDAHHWRIQRPGHATALAYTCKAIRGECHNLLLANNTFELRGITTDGMLSALEAFRSSLTEEQFALVSCLIVSPTELNPHYWTFWSATGLSTELSLAIAKAAWAKQSVVGVPSLSLQAKISYTQRRKDHVLHLEFDMDHIAESCRLVEWEMMGEVLSHLEHGKLQQIYKVLQSCSKQLKYLGLVPKR